MKKFVVIMILMTPALILAQNSAQTSEMEALKKQAAALSTTSSRHEVQLRNLIKASKAIHDSLRNQIKMQENNINALSDSLVVKSSEIVSLKTDLQNSRHRFSVLTKILFALFVIALILTGVIYYLVSQKSRKTNERIGAVSAEMDKNKKDTETGMLSLKKELEEKIKELAK